MVPSPRRFSKSCGNALLGAALTLLAATGSAANATADTARQFYRREAQRDLATFRDLDRSGAHVVTRDQVHGAVDFEARFDDIDINRDGVITQAEMLRYVELTYNVRPEELSRGTHGR